ncbi:MAG TPA: patatin-like phospholipase family protein [Paracoccaceae bacterium]|nr:patatin-like phospholipase family protein [Paracoccaceae bacterium]
MHDGSEMMPRRAAAKAVEAGTKTLNLALQGGGAHGAFAWGVIDRLLEDDRLRFEGITATSAGAMNAAILAYGMSEGGPQGARRALANFWRRVSHAAATGPLQPSLWDRITHNHSLDASPAFMIFDLMSRVFSPYQLNPTNWNPLRRVLEECVDFERLRASNKVKLFLAATSVRTGKARIFTTHEITADAVMASACLPFMFQAVEIEGEPYWDGGYMGNPAIFPLIYNCDCRDVVIVHINPLLREGTPRTAQEILNRINEISFNSSLMREMRVIEFVTRLIDDGTIPEGRMKRMLIHSIADDGMMRELSVTSKMNADWEFLTHLRDVGRARAEEWLTAHFDALGNETTVDFATYL